VKFSLASGLLCGLITGATLLLVQCGREQGAGPQPYSAALDALMKQGTVPLKIIRRARLGNDSPTW